MKILQISKYYYPTKGGIENHVFLLTELLKKRNIQITVLAYNMKNLKEIREIGNLKIVRLPQRLLLNVPFSFSLGRYMHNYDIVHLHLPNPGAVISYLITRPKGKLVITWHADIHKYKFLKFFYNLLQKVILEKADKILLTYPKAAEQLNSYRSKLEVVPLGINIPNNISFKEEDYILFIGRLVKYKGLEYLIKAMQQINTNLIIIGSGNIKKKLIELTKNLNLDGKIKFLGEVEEEIKNNYLQRCKLLILPSISKKEALGIVQLEAMAYSKPVICTKLNTGTDFINLNNYTGLVIPPKNVKAIIESVNFMLENEKNRREYGKNGRVLVKREFDVKLMESKIFKIYSELLSN